MAHDPVLSIHVIHGELRGESFRFTDSPVTVGKGGECDLVIDAPHISRRHGHFERGEDGNWNYVDDCSTNGSVHVVGSRRRILHNRDEPARVALEAGDRLQLAEWVAQIEFEFPAEKGPAFASPTTSQVVARSTTDARSYRKGLRRDSPISDLLANLARRMNGMTAIDEILELISTSAFEAFDAATHFTVCRRPQPDRPFAAAFHRLRGGSISGTPPLLSQTMLEETEAEGVGLLLKDKADHKTTDSIVEAGIQSTMCVPLKGHDHWLGVLQVDNRRTRDKFTKDDLDLLAVMALQSGLAIERAELHSQVSDMFEGFINASVKAIEARDPATAGHSGRVAEASLALAKAVNREGLAMGPFSARQMREINYAALLHDFGKVGVREQVLTKANRLMPHALDQLLDRLETARLSAWKEVAEEVLGPGDLAGPEALAAIEERWRQKVGEIDEVESFVRKVNAPGAVDDDTRRLLASIGRRMWRDAAGRDHPWIEGEHLDDLSIARGTLNRHEWENIRSHAALTARFLAEIPWSTDLSDLPRIAADHHEKLDGSGYPAGVSADAILPQTRILTICDIFDALTARDRPYRTAIPYDKAVEILVAERDRGAVDPELLDLFVDSGIGKTRAAG